ncbi:uncharacterized protein LOC114360351 [Ostrinia furnacalis]|uniref:uncharacterized protein LOC114360351 n=1 Tax=Ostrinia furnacalis TaxID=93504 RepID=UPI0010397769|nr:uncharacterized protein LOC114360351 [Ostrinia furnacalis]
MDWLRLFALLIAVASVKVQAEGPKKKIRIHLPQKVKHIHHHKKIYITNHPASSQYAPAYLPSAEGAMALPSNVALPAVASLVPFNSVELYDEPQTRLPGVTPAASKLLPLYRARGYYGPTPSDWDEQEYDLSPPPEHTDNNYAASDYTGPSAGPLPIPPKRVKVVKFNDIPRKKNTRKPKPKRPAVRTPRPPTEEEHPVSSFHEQFYSDVDLSGTIRKVKKPPRVEKIVDGDTEHIHTYSEEHIHKVVFDDGSKLVDPVGSMSAISGARPFIPFNNGQALLAIPPNSLGGFSAVGSLANPAQLEYAGYNPRDVTHDHIFHDHGEIPSDLDITKDTLGYPPKVSYNSQGLRINTDGANSANNKRFKYKYANKHPKPTKPTQTNDYSYYESIFTPFNTGLKKIPKPKVPQYDTQPQSNFDDFRSIPSFKLPGKHKPRAYGNSVSDYRLQSASVPSPFSVSSTVVHDYQPKSYTGALPPTGFSKFKDPFVNYKDGYANNYEYDTYASSSNVHTSEDKNDNSILSLQGAKGKKKSVSTQNINFGGQDHQTMIDHLEESGVPADLNDDDTPTALDSFSSFDDNKPLDPVPSTPYTIRETSPAYHYYASMAAKAMQNEQASMPEASNDNFQYAEAPTQSTTHAPSIATTTGSAHYFEMQSSNSASTEPPEFMAEAETRRRPKQKGLNLGPDRDSRQRYPVLQDYKADDRPMQHKLHQEKYLHDSDAESIRGQLKYGDKI